MPQNRVDRIFNAEGKHVECPGCRRLYGHLPDCPLAKKVDELILTSLEIADRPYLTVKVDISADFGQRTIQETKQHIEKAPERTQVKH